jgi:hypothetical protein
MTAVPSGSEMEDIVERIRNLRYIHVPVASQLFENLPRD